MSSVSPAYAPRPPLRQRRWWRRARRVVLIGLLAMLVVGWFWERGPKFYWYHRCANYDAPADTLIFDNDPPGAASLRARGRHWWLSCYVSRSARPMQQFWGGGLPTLVLHSRRTPEGKRLLVCVSVLRYLDKPDGYSIVLLHHTCSGPSLFPLAQTDMLPGETEVFVPSGRRLRLFAGKPDPQDASRFTWGYALDDAHGTIEGRLLDGGYVEMRTQTGPVVVKTAPR